MGLFSWIDNVGNTATAQKIRDFVGADTSAKISSGATNILAQITHPILNLFNHAEAVKKVNSSDSATLFIQGDVNTLNALTLGKAGLTLKGAEAITPSLVKAVAKTTVAKTLITDITGIVSNLFVHHPDTTVKVIDEGTTAISDTLDPSLITSIDNVVSGKASDTEYTQVKNALAVGGSILGAFLLYKGISNLPSLINSWEVRKNTKAYNSPQPPATEPEPTKTKLPDTHKITDGTNNPIGSGTVVNVYYPTAPAPVTAPVGEQTASATKTTSKKKAPSKAKTKKSTAHKYKSRKKINGKWRYTY